MAYWKCRKCGYDNLFGKVCGRCGSDKDLSPEEIKQNNLNDNFMITTTPTMEGYSIIDYFGVISAVVVLGTGFFSDLSAGWADLTGGRATGYQKKIDTATKAVISELTQKALEKNPEINALVGLKLDYTVAEKNMMILCGTATAIKFEKG